VRGRVLTIAPFLWSGAGRAIVRLQVELLRAGWDCSVVSSGSSKGERDWPEYVRELRAIGVPYHRIDFFERDPAVTWTSIDALADLLRQERFDVMHAHSGVPAFAATAARDIVGRRIPAIATLHSWNPERPAWMNRADTWSLNRCDRVVADSRSYAAVLRRHGVHANRLRTIHLGVDMPDAPRPSRTPGGARGLRVVSVARIEPRKDQATLLRGFAAYHRRFGGELALVGPDGDAEYAQRLRRDSDSRGWSDGVRFVGKAAHVAPWHRWADVFVTTSRDEGLGLSLLEAMAAGLPTVATLVDGHADFVRAGRNSLVIPVGSPAALADALVRLHAEPALRARLGRAGRATVQRQFDWERTAAQYISLFESVRR
jgi:glycosyltransferase involved in cell wall biosynthesis